MHGLTAPRRGASTHKGAIGINFASADVSVLPYVYGALMWSARGHVASSRLPMLTSYIATEPIKGGNALSMDAGNGDRPMQRKRLALRAHSSSYSRFLPYLPHRICSAQKAEAAPLPGRGQIKKRDELRHLVFPIGPPHRYYPGDVKLV